MFLRAFQIELNKFLTFICKIFHKNGSVFPGSITYNINQKILEKIKYPKYVIAVTGSSGKGSTTKLIAHILKNNGYDVVYNESGSNGIRAITTLILNHCNIFGKFLNEILLLEVDEKHLHLAFKKNKMTHLVLTNLTRDQAARSSFSDLVYESIRGVIDESVTVVLNADDPGLVKMKWDFKGKVITYGLSKTKYSSIDSNEFHIDHIYCPLCKKKLHYNYYHYGHIGLFSCPYCDFKRGEVNYQGSSVNLDISTMKINGKTLNLNKPIFYLSYATLASFSLCSLIGIPDNKIVASINQEPIFLNRGNEKNFHGRKVTILESKNENPLSYEQSLTFINQRKGKKTVILGFDHVSRRYRFNDISWLWDISFELLKQSEITCIIILGIFRYDIATRLFYAGINLKKIILIENKEKLISVIDKKTLGDIYIVACFEMTSILRKELFRNENN